MTRDDPETPSSTGPSARRPLEPSPAGDDLGALSQQRPLAAPPARGGPAATLDEQRLAPSPPGDVGPLATPPITDDIRVALEEQRPPDKQDLLATPPITDNIAATLAEQRPPEEKDLLATPPIRDDIAAVLEEQRPLDASPGGDLGAPPVAETWRPLTTPPPSERDNELMRDPPPGEHHLGRFAGYGAANRVRRILIACLSVLVVATVFVWYGWARQRPEPTTTLRQFELPAGTDTSDRPRVLAWSQGKARLGLTRAPPGVDTIELPDRTLKLKDGSDMAQFKVVVEDGKTTALDLVSGEIVEILHPGATPLLQP
ncbi:hypothetical protein [Nannocystis bainbridge]|uniref:Uncharacterized protein n=1 Tax=Nannocystis bainbridge TaxID=2995303 RepID=A0ABT5EAV8_9BACT|nr:hypothetical protein [Nannocystis bainbridge]MDC0722540.1 hypothetical protein [Nannocystis bainbridge]